MPADSSWKTDDWFVSPWDYMDEVTEGFAPPPFSVYIPFVMQ